jgi:hypothetical protein
MGIRRRDLTPETNFHARALTPLAYMTGFFELLSPAIRTFHRESFSSLSWKGRVGFLALPNWNLLQIIIQVISKRSNILLLSHRTRYCLLTISMAIFNLVTASTSSGSVTVTVTVAVKGGVLAAVSILCVPENPMLHRTFTPKLNATSLTFDEKSSSIGNGIFLSLSSMNSTAQNNPFPRMLPTNGNGAICS